MASTNNEYIKKARKNRKIKKIILLTIFFILCGLIVITYTDLFHIKKIILTNKSLITEDYVDKKVKELEGSNLVFLSDKKLKNIFKDNYYIESIKMKKTYPSTLTLAIKEKTALFYQKEFNNYNIISDEMVYIEKVGSLRSDNMIEIKGIDCIGRGIGEKISDSDREKEMLRNIYIVQEFLKEHFNNVKITSLDISDLSDIKCYFDNIEVYLGSDENIINKVKTAALIYDKGVVKNYIKVNFEGSPDFE
ncbi:MAG: FtsQ-type POTRA domain-containing protein [Clostridium sp.]|jgi:cell division protein FtsQ|nr:FtsQ-type POTRA domain-containing protein [Clostridium sp.]